MLNSILKRTIIKSTGIPQYRSFYLKTLKHFNSNQLFLHKFSSEPQKEL